MNKKVKMNKVATLRAGFKKPSKNNPLPYLRYQNVSIADMSNEKFPELVIVTNGPSKYDGLYGRKYVNLQSAMTAIDEYQAESLIGGGSTAVKKELMSVGINSGSPAVSSIDKWYSTDKKVQNQHMMSQYYID